MIRVDHKLCDRCGACISVCRTTALRLSDMVEVDAETCLSCGACVKVCPMAALHMESAGSDNGGKQQ